MRVRVRVVLGGVRRWGLRIVVRGGLLVDWGCHIRCKGVVGAAAGWVERGRCERRMQMSSGGRVRVINLTRGIRIRE